MRQMTKIIVAWELLEQGIPFWIGFGNLWEVEIQNFYIQRQSLLKK